MPINDSQVPAEGSAPAFSGVGPARSITSSTVEVIILNWNQPDDTIACVASLQSSHGVAPRIHVIDNGSAEALFDRLVLGLRTRPDVRITRLPENIGFAAGCNIGLRDALANRVDFAFVLNNDTIVAPDLIVRLLEVALIQPSFGVLAPAIYKLDQPHVLWSAGARRLRLPFARELGAAALAARRSTEDVDVIEVDYVTGCAMLLRPSALQQIGLFDERFFMYYEDAALCDAMRAGDWRIGIVPGAHLWHRVAGSTRDIPRQGLRLRTASRFQFYASRPHLGTRVMTLSWVTIQTIAQSIVDAVTGRFDQALGRIEGLFAGWRSASR